MELAAQVMPCRGPDIHGYLPKARAKGYVYKGGRSNRGNWKMDKVVLAGNEQSAKRAFLEV